MGCGHKKRRTYILNKGPVKHIRLDFNLGVKPDLVSNLESLPYPFKDNTFDEIHAEEVMEHLGKQGDWKFFFAQFDELARILKPNGIFLFTSPKLSSEWLWGDPGHTRYFGPECLVFLDRDQYAIQQKAGTAMTDYQFAFTSNWKAIGQIEHPHSNIIGLKNIKKEIDR